MSEFSQGTSWPLNKQQIGLSTESNFHGGWHIFICSALPADTSLKFRFPVKVQGTFPSRQDEPTDTYNNLLKGRGCVTNQSACKALVFTCTCILMYTKIVYIFLMSDYTICMPFERNWHDITLFTQHENGEMICC